MEELRVYAYDAKIESDYQKRVTECMRKQSKKMCNKVCRECDVMGKEKEMYQMVQDNVRVRET